MEKYKINNTNILYREYQRLVDSFQLFDSGLFSKFLDLYGTKFDFIVIDTPPFLSVAETSLLLGVADLKYLVVRHDLSKPNELQQSEANISQLGLSFDGLIYNAFQKPRGYFGYYQYYGNYQYKYYADRYLYKEYDYEKASTIILLILFIQGCALAKGCSLRQIEKDRDFINYDEDKIIYVEDLSTDILQDLSEENKIYKLELEIESILLFGACQKFSISGGNSDINSRVVVSDGTFFFPYAGNVDAEGSVHHKYEKT